MKYIISVIPVNESYIAWSESETDYRQSDYGMANAMPAGNLFPTRELAVSDEYVRLRKAGVRDEDITVQ